MRARTYILGLVAALVVSVQTFTTDNDLELILDDLRSIPEHEKLLRLVERLAYLTSVKLAALRREAAREIMGPYRIAGRYPLQYWEPRGYEVDWAPDSYAR